MCACECVFGFSTVRANKYAGKPNGTRKKIRYNISMWYWHQNAFHSLSCTRHTHMHTCLAKQYHTCTKGEKKMPTLQYGRCSVSFAPAQSEMWENTTERAPSTPKKCIGLFGYNLRERKKTFTHTIVSNCM